MALTRAQWFLGYTAFIFSGISGLMAWNVLVSLMYTLENNLYPRFMELSTTLGPTYRFTTAVVAVLMVFKTTNGRYVGPVSRILAALSLLGTGITVSVASDTMAGFVILHFLMAVAGGCQVSIFNSALSLSGLMPFNWAPAIGLGTSGAGIYCLVVWSVTKVAVDVTTIDGNKTAVWVMVVAGIVMHLLGMLFLWIFIRVMGGADEVYAEPETESVAMASVKKIDPSNLESSVASEVPEDGWWIVTKEYYLLFINMFMAVGITFMVYPGIAPSEYDIDRRDSDTIVAAFQLSDFVARLIMEASRPLNFSLTMPIKYLTVFNLSRFIFVVLSMHIFMSQSTNFILMLVTQLGFGLTYGYSQNNGYVLCRTDTAEQHRKYVFPISTVALHSALAIGSVFITPILRLMG